MTRKTEDQPNEPARSPPRKTPVAPPTADAAPQMLIALARACPGKVTSSSDMAAGLRAAAPVPWMIRPAYEHPFVCGGGRQQGADGEHGRAGHEHAAPAEQVRGTTRQQQQSAEREDVGVDHPGQTGRAESEVGLDGRKGHVDDRGVEHDDELGGHQQSEGDGAASALDETDARGCIASRRRLGARDGPLWSGCCGDGHGGPASGRRGACPRCRRRGSARAGQMAGFRSGRHEQRPSVGKGRCSRRSFDG